MEKRTSDRIKKRLQIKLNGKPAMLVNLNRVGLQLMVPVPPKNKKVKVILNVEGGDIALDAHIRWAQRIPGLRPMVHLGMSIEEAPENFYELLDKIS